MKRFLDIHLFCTKDPDGTYNDLYQPLNLLIAPLIAARAPA